MSGDDTVRLRPRRRRRWPAVTIAILLASGLGAGAIWMERVVPAVTAVPREPIPFATEAALRTHEATALTVFRFAPNPAILVLDFPDLATQGRMLNRVAVWAEAKGQPHDRLLDDAGLDAAIRSLGLTPDTFYYGHDYRGGDIARFFALADRDKIVLRPEEQELRQLMLRAAAEPFGFGAVISVPRAGPGHGIDTATRAIVLHHELSHGEYFANPAYAGATAAIWTGVLTGAERALFRAYLSNEGYDPALEDLMVNEMQAYLMHTPDPHFFDEASLGIAAPRLAAIRSAFRAGMPSCWLRDVTPDFALASRSTPRRRYFTVLSTTVPTAKLPPRRRRSSQAA